jgi:hypothetical protein
MLDGGTGADVTVGEPSPGRASGDWGIGRKASRSLSWALSRRPSARLRATTWRWYFHPLQSSELVQWIDRSSMNVAQRRWARADSVRLDGRGKRKATRRRLAELERLMGRPAWPSPDGTR